MIEGYKGHVYYSPKLQKTFLHISFQSPLLLNAMASLYLLAISSVCLQPIAATLMFTGQTLLLNDIPYYVPATPFVTVPSFSSLTTFGSANGLVPVTVVALPSSNSSLSNVGAILSGFGADDVWNKGFLEGMYSNDTLVLKNSFVIHSSHVIEHIANDCQAVPIIQ